MATIPSRFNTNVRSAPVQGRIQRSATSPELIGGGTDREFNQVAVKGLDALGNVALEQKKRDDVTSVLTADTLYKRAVAERLRLTREKVGRDSIGLTDQAEAWHEGDTNVVDQDPTEAEVEYQNHRDGMDDGQKQFWQAKRAQQKVGFKGAVAKHEQDQKLKLEEDAYVANNEESVNAAMAEFNDPGAVIQNRIEIQKNVVLRARQLGWTQERENQEMRRVMGAFHVGIVNAFLAGGDPASAEAYIEANKQRVRNKDGSKVPEGISKIPSTVLPGLVEAVRKRTVIGKAQAAFDKMRQTVPVNEWDEEAQKIRDPEVREKAFLLASRGQERNRKDKILDENDAAETVYNEWILGEDVPSLDKVPIHITDRLSISQKESLSAVILARGKHKDRATDTALHGQLMEMSATDKETFLEQDFHGKFGSRLSDADIKKFQKMKADMLNGGEPLNGMPAINDLFKKFGWNTEAKSESRYKAILEMEAKIVREVKTTGQKVTPQRLNEIAKEVMSTGFVFAQDALQARKEIAKEAEKDLPKDSVTLTQQVSAGINASSKGKNAEQRRVLKGQVELTVNKEIAFQEQVLNRPLRDEERQVYVDEALADKVMIEGFIFDDEVLMSEVPEEDLDKVFVEVAGEPVKLTLVKELMKDRELRARVRSDLKAAGLPETLQNIADAIGGVKRDAAQAGVIDSIKLRAKNKKLFDTMADQKIPLEQMQKVIEGIEGDD